MVDDEIGCNARLLIRDRKVKKISDRLWEVGNEIVKKVTKPGRSFLTCTCKSYTMYCKENPRCYHKEAVILFEEKFQKRIDKLIKMYEHAKENGITVEPDVIIQDLKDLKYFK